MSLKKFAEYDTTVIANGVEEANVNQSSNRSFEFNYLFPITFLGNGEQQLSETVQLGEYTVTADPLLKLDGSSGYTYTPDAPLWNTFLVNIFDLFGPSDFPVSRESVVSNNDLFSAVKKNVDVDVSLLMQSTGAGCDYTVSRNGAVLLDGTFNQFNFEGNVNGDVEGAFDKTFETRLRADGPNDTNPAIGTWELELSNLQSGRGDDTVQAQLLVDMELHGYSYFDDVVIS